MTNAPARHRRPVQVLLAGLLVLAGCTSTGAPETVTVTSVTVAAPPATVTVPVAPGTSTPTVTLADPSSDAANSDPATPTTADDSNTGSEPGLAWPKEGAAAVRIDSGRVLSSGDDKPRAIASVAKMMTAYLILLAKPLAAGANGPTYTVTAADSDRRYRLDQSGVPVKKGEVISERDMLEALLLPSANNIAAMLAAWQAGSEAAFVAAMNAKAAELGMTDTHYTDPSGYTDSTVSTARDQLILTEKAMANATFAALVKLKVAQIPVAGTIYNTNPNLGKDGFVGVKTGSDDAAGGCLAFRVVRGSHVITGVVLGQTGTNLISAGANAARALVASVAG